MSEISRRDDELEQARRRAILTRALHVLGQRWYGRKLALAELARACRLSGAKPSSSMMDYIRGKTRVSGPLSALVEAYLAGAEPPDGIENIRELWDQPSPPCS